MRELLPAVRYITLALGDEYPLVVRRLALAGMALLASAAVLLLAAW